MRSAAFSLSFRTKCLYAYFFQALARALFVPPLRRTKILVFFRIFMRSSCKKDIACAACFLQIFRDCAAYGRRLVFLRLDDDDAARFSTARSFFVFFFSKRERCLACSHVKRTHTCKKKEEPNTNGERARKNVAATATLFTNISFSIACFLTCIFFRGRRRKKNYARICVLERDCTFECMCVCVCGRTSL